MKIIKQFKLEIEPTQQIEIPFNAEILTFGVSLGGPCIWALVDASQKNMTRTFVIVADETALANALNHTKYIGSFFHKDAPDKMLHVFEN